MEKGIERILAELKATITDRFHPLSIKVFGSTARGDRLSGSDIDGFVHLECADRGVEEELYDICYDLELKHDCLIDLIVVDTADLSGRSGNSPLLQKVISEGAEL